MNAVTLDSMAFDHFETAGEDYLVDIDGSGFVGSIAGGVLGAGYGTIIGALVDGVGQGLIYGGAGFAAGYSL